MKNPKTAIIACKTVIEEMGELIPSDVEAHPVESGLHTKPDRLRTALQAMIDEITEDTDIIILGYGLCSMGVVGLKAADSTLIIPRQEDCVSIFLGSRTAYREALHKEPGTYFLSKGWIDAGISLLEELKGMEDRYGRERARRIMERMIQHYTRLAFIDMGYEEQEQYRRYAQKAADKLRLRYQEIRGTTRLLKRICRGPYDEEEFIIAPPAHVIRLEDFGLGISGKPRERTPAKKRQSAVEPGTNPV